MTKNKKSVPLKKAPRRRSSHRTIVMKDGFAADRKDLLSQALASIRTAVYITDLGGVIIYANPAIRFIHGWKPEEVIGRKASLFFEKIPGNPPDLAGMIRSSARDGSWSGEIFNHSKAGRVFPTHLTISTIYGRKGEILGYVGVSRDISEKRQMEDDLERAKDWLSNMFEATPDLVYLKGLKMKYLLVNKPFAEFSGRTPDEIKGLSDRDILPPNLARQCRRSDRIALASVTPVSSEESFTTADGRKLYFNTIKTTVRDKEGNKIGLLGVSRDITAIKQDKEALRESQSLYKFLADNSLSAIVIVAADGRILFTNQRLFEISGYSLNEVEGMDAFRFIHPDDRELAKYYFKQRILGRPAPLQYCCRTLRRDGSTAWIELRAVTITYQEQKAVMINFADLTASREAEEQLKESRRFLATLTNNLPGLAYRCKNDRDWTMEYVSGGSTALTGYRPDELVANRVVSFNDIIHKDHRERLWKKWQRLLRQRAVFKDEYPIITASGEIKWVWEQGQGVFDESGKVVALEGFITDITEHKGFEEYLREAAKFRALGILSMGIAHEFNNILMGISGYAQLASASPQDQAIVEKACRIILQQSERAGVLIRRLSGFGRRHPHTPRAVDPAGIFDDVISLQEKNLRQDRIEIQRKYAPPCQIWADPDQIQQVFFNLLLNARAAVTPGKGVITIRTAKKGKTAEIRVSDNGVGIGDEEMPKIFQAFFTTKATQENEGIPSLGLGLWVSRQIVEEHEGTIRAESAPGKGATFIVNLPRAPAAKARESKRKKPALQRKGPHHEETSVLIVDDESKLLEIFRGHLERKGLKVSTAVNGAEALKLCRRSRFKVILLDYLMPGLHGKELIRKLKAAVPDSVIFMVTGQLITEDERREIGSLVNGWLFKPVELAALEELIRRSCRPSPPDKSPGK